MQLPDDYKPEHNFVGEYTDYPIDDEEPKSESCDSKDCPHMSVQGCMLSYGCIWYSDETNEQERKEEYEQVFF